LVRSLIPYSLMKHLLTHL
jgi:nitrate reductase (NAD(P)H)